MRIISQLGDPCSSGPQERPPQALTGAGGSTTGLNPSPAKKGLGAGRIFGAELAYPLICDLGLLGDVYSNCGLTMAVQRAKI